MLYLLILFYFHLVNGAYVVRVLTTYSSCSTIYNDPSPTSFTIPTFTVTNLITKTNPVSIGNPIFTPISNSINAATIVQDKTVVVTVPCTTSSTYVSPKSTAIFIETTSTFTFAETITSIETTTPVVTPTFTTSEIKSAVTSDGLTPSLSIPTTSTYTNANGFNGDIFEPISTDPVSNVFIHQDLPVNIPQCVSNDMPFQTNKFFVNSFLGEQTDSIFSYPYILNYDPVGGISIQSSDNSKRVFGSSNTNNYQIASYFFNPVKLGQVIFTASSFQEPLLCVNRIRMMSANIQLNQGATDYIEFPIVQGMGFVTGIYHGNLIPRIKSNVGIKSFVFYFRNNNILKYGITLNDGTSWLLYLTLPSQDFSIDLSIQNEYGINYIQASMAIDNLIIQVALEPSNPSLTTVYDNSAGLYVTEAILSGYSNEGGTSAEYGFTYSTSGKNIFGQPLVFILPHIEESLTSTTASKKTGIYLDSTTKGQLSGYSTNSIFMTENLETNIQFLPWVDGLELHYTAQQLQLISEVANNELSVDIKQMVVSIESNYFAGKLLDKFAYILLVVSEIIEDEKLTLSTLSILKATFDIFISNTQNYPLMYDTKFGGITSTASQNGDVNADYGSGYYNDHHFHYGYFIHAAAVVGYIDNKWGDGNWVNENKWWVNSLIRDVANPSSFDKNFPVFRMFDWFSGHSWASGLFSSSDGRNQESSSEDYNFAYGMKLWGRIQGDSSMETRGDLMISIMKRSMRKYYLYTDDNEIEPSNFIGNKVAGILFENKIHYTTYFGSPDLNPEYVHGIHMLPITPISSRVRDPYFVQQEWEQQISNFIANVKSGWLSILNLNKALYDPISSYAFFASPDFSGYFLDDGLSRTWCLAFSAGMSNLKL
ncbi:glucan endo-1,3-beta-D-glucosidase 1 [[Candida] anglica]|uniref:glucan endo-1,3-beta-D-glucosidase n=1 Tax=[Candida] anglica TaxID=148631 RepID=A0ABP0E9C0_9ASCO